MMLDEHRTPMRF
jgi:hypothetical protein